MVFTKRQKNHGRPLFFCILQHTALVVFSAHSEPGHAQADRPMYPQSGSRRHAVTASRVRTSGVVWRGEMQKKVDAGRALTSAARWDSLQLLLRAAVGIDHRTTVLQSKPSTSRQKRDLAMPWVKFVFIDALIAACMHACMPIDTRHCRRSPSPVDTRQP